MGNNRKANDNYNKDYFTADGIPQPATEYVPTDEKQDLTRQRPEAPKQKIEPTGPGQDLEIARAMGQGGKGGNKGGKRKKK
jgi:hypothetical protein